MYYYPHVFLSRFLKYNSSISNLKIFPTLGRFEIFELINFFEHMIFRLMFFEKKMWNCYTAYTILLSLFACAHSSTGIVNMCLLMVNDQMFWYHIRSILKHSLTWNILYFNKIH